MNCVVILKESVVQLERGIEKYTCLGGNVGSTLVKYSAVHCDLNTFKKPVQKLGLLLLIPPSNFWMAWGTSHMTSHVFTPPQRFKRIHPPNLQLLQTASLTRDLFLGSWHPFTRWGVCQRCCMIYINDIYMHLQWNLIDIGGSSCQKHRDW